MRSYYFVAEVTFNVDELNKKKKNGVSKVYEVKDDKTLQQVKIQVYMGGRSKRVSALFAKSLGTLPMTALANFANAVVGRGIT